MVWQRKFDLGGIPSSRTIILRSNMDDERNSKTNGLELAVLLENQLEKAFRRKTAKYAIRQGRGWHALCVLDEVGCTGFASIQAQWNHTTAQEGSHHTSQVPRWFGSRGMTCGPHMLLGHKLETDQP